MVFLKKLLFYFHRWSNYDYHFIIKEFTKEFEKQFICLGGNTAKCITFTVPIWKGLTRVEENQEETTKHISYKLQFIEIARIMVSF